MWSSYLLLFFPVWSKLLLWDLGVLVKRPLCNHTLRICSKGLLSGLVSALKTDFINISNRFSIRFHLIETSAAIWVASFSRIYFLLVEITVSEKCLYLQRTSYAVWLTQEPKLNYSTFNWWKRSREQNGPGEIVFSRSIWLVEMLTCEIAGYWKHARERIFTAISSEVWGSKLIRTQVFITVNLPQAGGTDLLAGKLSWRDRKAQGQVTRKGTAHLQKTCFHFLWGSVLVQTKGLRGLARTSGYANKGKWG